jgi:pilus assembly protein CpaE
MLRALLISQRPEHRAGLDALCRQTGLAQVIETFHEYPQWESLKRFIRAHSPQAIFLDLASEPEAALALAQTARADMPGLALVGILDDADPRRLMQAMREGIAEVLYQPFPEELFRESMARVEEHARQAPADRAASELVYSFLPAKAGDGCSVVAANAALAMARMPESEVLLADLDLYAGTTRFLLKLQNAFSAFDALERITDLDNMVWSDIVTHTGPLHVLGSGEIRKPLDLMPARVRSLIDFMRRRYRSVCLDLSGVLDELAVEAIQESRRTFLVVAPELASVYLAREKLRYLRTLGLEDKLGVILNRWYKDAPINMTGIEEILGLPIQHTLPEDRAAVHAAVLGGGPVAAGSALGKEFTKMAFTLSDAKTLSKAAPPVKRMVDYFTLAPGRYTLMK